ncbi:hypothetical protein [Idiomarina sp.]|uniref:hypothetical protein n=1 Tax=Idiomarina sp. TaxID=1874361 RepID=UPI0025BB42A5|nr:hypothetical protein [Idiomarina sp.]
MTKYYEFSLRFDVSNCGKNQDQIDDSLFEAGCDDALVRHGRGGEINITFERQSSTALDAMQDAQKQVLLALPQAKLLEVKPDFVGPTDIARVYSITRQRVQALVNTKLSHVHPFTSVGNTQIFRLANVIDALDSQGRHHADEAIREAATAAMQLNRQNL